MNTTELQDDLAAIMKKHNICLSGQVFVNDFDPERYEDGCTLNLHENGILLDIGVPLKPQQDVKKNSNNDVSLTIFDRDKLFAQGHIQFPADGNYYANRGQWNNALKKHGCVEVGNEYNRETEKPRPTLGKYDCRSNLEKATHDVFEKHGIRD